MKRKWPSFEELRKTAEQDPEALERFRQQEIEALIESAPEPMKRRLRGIQFQIDCKRKIHESSPLGSCISISKMMYESVGKLQQALQGDQGKSKQQSSGRVLSFPITG